jgi:hypothetical protein
MISQLTLITIASMPLENWRSFSAQDDSKDRQSPEEALAT